MQECTCILLQVIIEKDRNVQYDSYIIQFISCPGEKEKKRCLPHSLSTGEIIFNYAKYMQLCSQTRLEVRQKKTGRWKQQIKDVAANQTVIEHSHVFEFLAPPERDETAACLLIY